MIVCLQIILYYFIYKKLTAIYSILFYSILFYSSIFLCSLCCCHFAFTSTYILLLQVLQNPHILSLMFWETKYLLKNLKVRKLYLFYSPICFPFPVTHRSLWRSEIPSHIMFLLPKKLIRTFLIMQLCCQMIF